MRDFIRTITSKAYWQYLLLSRSGISSIFAIFGAIYLVVAILNLFQIYSIDQYNSWAFIGFLVISLVCAVVARPPRTSISVAVPDRDVSIEVRVADIFDVSGAVMVSANTSFEADVARGKIAPNSLQGQFTARYFPGNQDELLRQIDAGVKALEAEAPYPMGTTVPIMTHGKTFYFTAMADLNESGNASTTKQNVKLSMDGLWRYVRESGELQELAVPLIGSGRGRLKLSRRKLAAMIAESFANASEIGKVTDKLIIVISSDDANHINLYAIKDHLNHILSS